MAKRFTVQTMKMDRISGVDNPAQVGAEVRLMKRADGKPEPKSTPVSKNLAAVLTGETDGHQHGIDVNYHEGRMNVYVSHANGPDEEYGHSHAMARGTDGDFVLATVAGHTHTIDQTSMAQALLALTMKGKNSMAEVTQKNEPTVESLQKVIDRNTAILALPAVQRAHFDGLTTDPQDAYLAKSAEGRAEEVEAIAKAATDADPVVYKTMDNIELRKSAGEALIAMAKANDAMRKENTDLRTVRDQERLEKRAEADLPNLPGDVATRAAMLKAIDGIADEAHREAAHNALKAQNKAMAKAFETVGVGGQPEPGSPDDELEKMAKAHASEHNVSHEAAYAAVMETPKGEELYAKLVN